ncbi:MAG: hypothetical protein ACXV2J_13820, partial [Actinomycetes bacterium]
MSEAAGQLLQRLRRLSSGTPLRVRLVIALLALVAIALVVTGVTATTQLKGYLVQQVDRYLHSVQVPARGPDRFDGNGEHGPGGGRSQWYAVTDTRGSALPILPSPDLDVAPPKITRAQITGAGAAPFTAPSNGKGPNWRVSVEPGS